MGFEKQIANSFFFFKGRVALYAILKAMGIKSGDEVIVPAFTCVVVPNAIVYLGAKPVYVDVNPKSYNIDTEKIEGGKGKSWEVGKAKAIIAQHTFGIPADMDGILEIAKKYNLYVIEDSCHAIGSKYKGKEVGTIGDAAFFSSQWSKPITTGLGGWAVINNPELKKKVENIYGEFINPSFKDDCLLRFQYFLYSNLVTPSLFWFARNSYRTLSKYGIAIGSSSNEELDYKMPVFYKKRMSSWQQKILMKKLRGIAYDNEHRKSIASLYERLLKGKGIETVELPDHYDPVFLRYPVLVENKRKILEEAQKRKIELGDWFLSPLHPNLDGWEKVAYQKGMCPVAEDICRYIVNLPTHQGIKEKEAEKIVGLVGER